MYKERSLGIVIISKIEIVIGTLGSLYCLVLVILNLLTFPPSFDGEYSRVSYFNGFLALVIFWFAFTIILITGKLTYQLRPLGRILHFFIADFIIICYILTLFLMRIDFNDIKNFLSALLFFPDGVVMVIPLIIAIFLIYYFKNPKIKEQFKESNKR